MSYTVENGILSRGVPVTRTYWRPLKFLRWWLPCVIIAYFGIVRWGNVGPKYLVGGEVK
jgi:hypothetical protein